MKLYERNEKQAFISFGKQSAPASEMQQISESYIVLKLADGTKVIWAVMGYRGRG